MTLEEYKILGNHQKKVMWNDYTGKVPLSKVWKHYPPPLAGKPWLIPSPYEYLGGL